MKKSILVGIFIFSIFFFGYNVVLAAEKVNTCGDSSTSGYECTSDTSGKPCVSDKCLAEAENVKCCKSSGGSNTSLPNPLGTTNINKFASTLINYVLGLVGTISLILFIYGGLVWMTSAGSSDKVKKGKDIFIWAVIGLAVVFTSYILVKFVIQGVQGTLL